MRMRRCALAVVLAVVAACGSDDTDSGGTTTSSPDPSTTVSTSTTAPPDDAGDLPDTPLRAVLESTYPATFDEESFGVAPGSITAAWYAVGDRWAVHYDGLTPEEASGKCPGNSIESGGGFSHISNSPYGALACAGYEDLPNYAGRLLPPGSLFRCGESTIVYVTEIPLTAEGNLYGSLEQVRDDGTVQGMTSMVAADPDQAPEIELSDCGAVS